MGLAAWLAPFGSTRGRASSKGLHSKGQTTAHHMFAK
jgi:hypothetical protein